jgi:hypothetical protein
MAEAFDAQISVSRGDETVNATSIMGLMMLGAAIGTNITIAGKRPRCRGRRLTLWPLWWPINSARIEPQTPLGRNMNYI